MLRWFYIGLGCLLVSGLLYAESVRRTGREPGDWAAAVEAPDVTLPELRLPGHGEPVLIFQLGRVESVAIVREAVAPDRIVASTAAGFALAGGRIVAAGPDAAAVLLRLSGWEERPLEIFEPASRLPDRYAPAPREAGVDLDALAHKSHLSRQEAMAVMEHLD